MVKSINEPDGPGREWALQPMSINEPPVLPELPEGFGTPAISSLEPADCVIGGEDFTLVVSGTQFYPGSVIFFAGHDEPTTYDEDGATLSTGVKPSLWANPVVVQVQVRNLDKWSEPVDFTFNPSEAET